MRGAAARFLTSERVAHRASRVPGRMGDSRAACFEPGIPRCLHADTSGRQAVLRSAVERQRLERAALALKHAAWRIVSCLPKRSALVFPQLLVQVLGHR